MWRCAFVKPDPVLESRARLFHKPRSVGTNIHENSQIGYYVNSRFSILPELRSIILKTAGAGEGIRHELEGLGQIEVAFIYGSFAAGDADRQSDIDLMLVGKINLTQLAPIIARLEKGLGRAVNYTAFTPEEWREKQHKREPFVENVLNSPKVMLIGGEDALRATRSARTDQVLQSSPRRNSKTAKSRGTRSSLCWLKSSSASVQTSLVNSSSEPIIMVQPIQNWECDNLPFPLLLRN